MRLALGLMRERRRLLLRGIIQGRRAAEALRRSERRFRDFAAAGSDWFWETDAAQVHLAVPNVEGRTGAAPERYYGKTPLELIAPGADPAEIDRHRLTIAARKQFHDLEYHWHGPGGDIWLSASGIPVFDDDGGFSGYRGTCRDITDKRRGEERLRHLVHHDDLTGIPNRLLLLDRLERAIAGAQREGEVVSVMLLDLDGFKEVNDTLGHATGDRLLRAVAQRIAAAIRASDTLARLGGDEFAIVHPAVRQPEDVAALGGQDPGHVRSTLRRSTARRCTSRPASASPCSRRTGGDADDLLRNADLALYRAKAEGRGRFRFFEPAMDEAAQARRRLERELRQALERDELVLHYQPQLELATGRFTGVEALVRWNHPERGLVHAGRVHPPGRGHGPDPAARRLGACARRAGRPSAVAGAGLAAEHGGQHLAGAAAQRPSPPGGRRRAPPGRARAGAAGAGDHRERADREHRARAGRLPRDKHDAAILRELTRGIRLAIDDFGVGYSSLAYLKYLPVQTIKIDRSFLQGIGADPAAEALLRAIVALGRSLGKRLVAEGVENDRQLAFVRELGCDKAQGFHIARPRPAAEIERLLAPPASRSAAGTPHRAGATAAPPPPGP